ncbi:NucA/NucB deoxyribonuclease domain-containing protein [Streptomyces sp. NPDC059533]|uniref:NucA/NucB deoxyribonuclease domain-containing protein n=1 Tax=Streptomyces sp. NPDC059533 TaxID=3346858 RepID=UPI003698B1B1
MRRHAAARTLSRRLRTSPAVSQDNCKQLLLETYWRVPRRCGAPGERLSRCSPLPVPAGTCPPPCSPVGSPCTAFPSARLATPPSANSPRTSLQPSWPHFPAFTWRPPHDRREHLTCHGRRTPPPRRPDPRHPLPRITDAILERANRTSACPAFRKRAQGQSCDEYPFARTNQGASKSDRRDWGWAWVPISEQNSQARCLFAFYQAQRVLNGDKFWVEVP